MVSTELRWLINAEVNTVRSFVRKFLEPHILVTV